MFIEKCPPNSIQHVVEEGDTFWKLSKAYGINIQNIVDANPGINPQNLQIGSTLCIPIAQTTAAPMTSEIQPATCPKGTWGYTIQSGDTLWKLSQAYGVNIQSILEVNPGINPQNLQIGSNLCIPIAQTMSAPQTTAAPMTSEIQPATCPKGTWGYTIQSGDTLWKLSQDYVVNIQSILEVNPGINPQNLQIGSNLCIPIAQTMPAPSANTAPPIKTAPINQPATCPKGTWGYTIQSGDTLWKLSQDYGVNIQSILEVNPGINPQNLQIGSNLCIPIAQTMSAPSVKTAPPIKTAPINQPATCPKGTFGYTIQSGDTLWKLSQAYGVNIQSILEVNPGINPQNLQIGSNLCIPIAQTMSAPSVKTTPLIKTAPINQPATCPKGTFGYTIQSGDTLWKLSQAYGVNIQSILEVNPGINPQNLQIGSNLCIPIAQTMPAPSVKTTPPTRTAPQIPATPLTSEILPAACPKGTWSYTIQNGDTLWKLSQAYGVNIQSILEVNPGINPQNLQIGSNLCIPIAQTMLAPSVKTTPPIETAPQTMPASLRHFSYCIKRCDTISRIARNFYVSVESILNENPGINPRCLQVGTYINVPVNCCIENTWRYTVMAGETLNGIANKLNICPSVLIAANPNIDLQHLFHGQVICIPKE
jgi:peptidoglycan DL-endopeptidase LytF